MIKIAHYHVNDINRLANRCHLSPLHIPVTESRSNKHAVAVSVGVEPLEFSCVTAAVELTYLGNIGNTLYL